MKKYFLIIMILLPLAVFAQEEIEEGGESSEAEFEEGRFSAAIVLGHTYLYGAKDVDGEELASYVPMMAFDINYYLGERLGIGLHTDIIFETIFLEASEDNEVVERDVPIAPAVMLGYKLGKHFLIGAGMGAEFAGSETFVINRISLEYGAEMGKGWEFFALASHDIRWDIYDTLSLGFGVAKRF